MGEKKKGYFDGIAFVSNITLRHLCSSQEKGQGTEQRRHLLRLLPNPSPRILRRHYRSDFARGCRGWSLIKRVTCDV